MLPPINTGQRFAEGMDLEQGECERCGREGQTGQVLITLRGEPLKEFTCCAECMADFVAGTAVMPEFQVYAQSKGRWQQLGAA